MKLRLLILALLLISGSGFSQSGRRVKGVKVPVPPVEEPTKEAVSSRAKQDQAPPVTAEKNQDYRCTNDGTLARILDDEVKNEEALSSRAVDTRAVITSKPKPSYTKEARRYGVQGFVVLRVVLSSKGEISRIRVMRGLPAGLTENAIKAACKLGFKPALKDGQPVSQWLNVEYVFRLADSSIFRP